MNLKMLARLSNDGLMQLKEAVEAEIAKRFDTSVRVGRTATFVDNRQNKLRTVHIEKVNIKTVTCVETGASFSPGQRWKVSLSALKVVPVAVAAQATKTPIVDADKPKTDTAVAW